MKKVLVLLAMVLGTTNMYAQDYDLQGLAKACKEYSKLSGFHDGLASVSKDGKWGFIDKTGQQVVPCNYSSVESFYGGLAIVVLNGKYGFVDNTGREVIPCKFESAKNFCEGFAGVKINGKWGFIDKTGKFIRINGMK